jgi:hypothetical protein
MAVGVYVALAAGAQSGRRSARTSENTGMEHDGAAAAIASVGHAHSARSVAQKKDKLQKLRNLRLTQVLERVIQRNRMFVQPPTDTGSSLYYISLKWSLFCVVLSSIGGQTPGPIGPKIGTRTHWDSAMKIGGSAKASAHPCARCARKRAHSIPCPV